MRRMGQIGATALARALMGAALGAVIWTGPLLAQEGQASLAASPILSLDQDALFARSRFGQAVLARLQVAANQAEAESRKLDAELETEERALTVQRGTLSAEEFAPLATAFDEKVQRLRAEREAAADDLRAQESAARQQFLQAAAQVIGDVMVERGAVAIIDKAAIIVSLTALDVTEDVVARLDKVLDEANAAQP